MDTLALRNKLTNGKDLSIAEGEYLRRIMVALDESLKLQSHYARLLNMHDGGERKEFANADAWLARLAEMTERGIHPMNESKTIGGLLAKFPDGFSVGPGGAINKTLLATSHFRNVAQEYPVAPSNVAYLLVEMTDEGEEESNQ